MKYNGAWPLKSKWHINRHLKYFKIKNYFLLGVAEIRGHGRNDNDSILVTNKAEKREYGIKLASKYPELEAEWAEDNEIEFSKCTVANMYKARWICSKCHYGWNAIVHGRTRMKTGCPKCRWNIFLCKYVDYKGGRIKATDQNNVLFQYPDLAEEWYYANNKMLPEECTVSSGYRACWKCSKCNHIWFAVVSCRTKYKTGCPKCGWNWDKKLYAKRGRKQRNVEGENS